MRTGPAILLCATTVWCAVAVGRMPFLPPYVRHSRIANVTEAETIETPFAWVTTGAEIVLTLPTPTPAPTPTPCPTYDDQDLPDDEGEDRDVPICHYDESGTYGSHEWATTRQAAAHLTQHPFDFKDWEWEVSYDPCPTLHDRCVENSLTQEDDDETLP